MQKKAGDCKESSDALRSPLLLRARTISMRRVSVKAYTLSCCCNVKMSSPNCSVKRSSLNGDLHVEPEGTASAGAVEGAVWRAADECPGGRRPPDHCAAGPAAEAPVRGPGPRRARARPPPPSLAPAGSPRGGGTRRGGGGGPLTRGPSNPPHPR